MNWTPVSIRLGGLLRAADLPELARMLDELDARDDWNEPPPPAGWEAHLRAWAGWDEPVQACEEQGTSDRFDAVAEYCRARGLAAVITVDDGEYSGTARWLAGPGAWREAPLDGGEPTVRLATLRGLLETPGDTVERLRELLDSHAPPHVPLFELDEA